MSTTKYMRNQLADKSDRVAIARCNTVVMKSLLARILRGGQEVSIRMIASDPCLKKV